MSYKQTQVSQNLSMEREADMEIHLQQKSFFFFDRIDARRGKVHLF